MWWRARLSPALESLDDDHVPAAARAWRADIIGLGRRIGRRLGIDDPVLFADRREVPQERAAIRQVREAAIEGRPAA
jgi:hypothetical protein